MKRILTICIIAVFWGYALVLFSSFNFLGINYIPYLKQLLNRGRKFAGIGALFTKEATLDNYTTSYRFYQHGKWTNWQLLEKPLFNDYTDHGNIAALKHSRLDGILSQRLYFLGFKKHKLKKLENTLQFKYFTSHLFYSHNENKIPDSLQIKYIRKSTLSLDKERQQELLNFKCKP